MGAREGLLNVWVPHATAGLAVIETGAGSDTDLLAALRDLLPADDRWRHRHGSPGHGRDHVLPAAHRAVDVGAGARRRARRWAPGSRSAWSTPTATTRCGRSGCRSCRAEAPSRVCPNGHGAAAGGATVPCVAGRGSAGAESSPPPWWDEPGRRAHGRPADPHPALPWPAGGPPRSGRAPRFGGRAARGPSFVARAVGTSPRPAVLLAVGVLVGVLGVALGVTIAVRGTGGTGSVTTPFLSYSPPPGWSAAPADPGATTDAPALVGVVRGAGYTCGAEEFVRGFAGAALLPVDATADPADRAERVARWFAVTSFAGADGTPPDVAVAPPRPVRVGGPDGPVDGTVTEATVRVPAGRDGCAASGGTGARAGRADRRWSRTAARGRRHRGRSGRAAGTEPVDAGRPDRERGAPYGLSGSPVGSRPDRRAHVSASRSAPPGARPRR